MKNLKYFILLTCSAIFLFPSNKVSSSVWVDPYDNSPIVLGRRAKPSDAREKEIFKEINEIDIKVEFVDYILNKIEELHEPEQSQTFYEIKKIRQELLAKKSELLSELRGKLLSIPGRWQYFKAVKR